MLTNSEGGYISRKIWMEGGRVGGSTFPAKFSLDTAAAAIARLFKRETDKMASLRVVAGCARALRNPKVRGFRWVRLETRCSLRWLQPALRSICPALACIFRTAARLLSAGC